MSQSQLRGLLDKHGLHLRRELGQNFIVEEHVAERVAELAGIEAGDCVIEVGTGLGMLTRAISKRAKFVTTVEIDSGLVRALEAEDLLPSNVELIHADARNVDFRGWLNEIEGPARIIANLPYSVATPLLRTFLDLRDRLEALQPLLLVDGEVDVAGLDAVDGGRGKVEARDVQVIGTQGCGLLERSGGGGQVAMIEEGSLEIRVGGDDAGEGRDARRWIGVGGVVDLEIDDADPGGFQSVHDALGALTATRLAQQAPHERLVSTH